MARITNSKTSKRKPAYKMRSLPPPLLQLPCCLICNTNIPPVPTSFIFRGLRQAYDPGQFLYCKASELDDVDFSLIGQPAHWRSLFRLIIIGQNVNSKNIPISGLGAIGPIQGIPTVIPKDKTMAFIGTLQPKVVQDLKGFFILNPHKKFQSFIAVPVHDRCFSLARKVIGPAVETDPVLLVEALNKYNMEQELPFRPAMWTIRSISMRSSVQQQDPWIIPAIGRLIRWGKFLKQTRRPRKASNEVQSKLAKLPVEIQCEIFDYLSCEEGRKWADVMRLPPYDEYWWGRVPREFVFEMQGVGKQDVDWHYICVNLDRMMSTDIVLENRAWLMDCLAIVKQEMLGC